MAGIVTTIVIRNNGPWVGIAVDAVGMLYGIDSSRSAIYKIATSGMDKHVFMQLHCLLLVIIALDGFPFVIVVIVVVVILC